MNNHNDEDKYHNHNNIYQELINLNNKINQITESKNDNFDEFKQIRIDLTELFQMVKNLVEKINNQKQEDSNIYNKIDKTNKEICTLINKLETDVYKKLDNIEDKISNNEKNISKVKNKLDTEIGKINTKLGLVYFLFIKIILLILGLSTDTFNLASFISITYVYLF